MSTQAIITLVVFVAVIVLLIWKPIHPIVIGACIPTVLALTGVLDASTAFSDFANTTVIFFMSLLVVGGAIFKTVWPTLSVKKSSASSVKMKRV